ncbi:MAG TPA: zinc ABC transporter substrate-binding protein [Gammaproteobacteria bacterium]|nr:zinc ABC transporter substrate-binding protein [Gammaproteobacteria bacterium]
MKSLLIVTIAVLVTATRPAHAALEVFTCEPEWAALATELGGTLVNAESATTPQQDPHYIQARPSLIAKVRRAALVVCTGADLEVGWLPLLLRQAGNAAVQPGQPGSLVAADYVELLDKPSSVDRSLGDVHPYGNPHIQTDPRNIGKVAAALAERLAMLDPPNAATYRARSADFAMRWQAAVERWSAAIEPVRGKQVVTHHKGWVYLESWAGLTEVGNLEPKPGLPPSAAHLAELLDLLKGKDVAVIIRSVYEDGKASDWLAARTSIPDVVLPHTVGSVPGADDLFGMFDVMVKTLTEARR